MKIKNYIAALLSPLFFANGSGSLLPVFAGDTNCSSHALAASDETHLRLLAAALRDQRMNMDVIANNLANVNTTGFKASQLRFQDLTCDRAGQTPLLKGAKPVLVKRLFRQGELSQTGDDFDLAIQGNGFFEVQMPDGTLAFTRDGGFRTDLQGRIVTSEGYPVQGFVPVPQGVIAIRITDRGQAIYSTVSGSTTFQVQLARFANPADLDAIGANLFKATVSSGQPELGNPGENGCGSLQQGFLELSNVSVEQEKVNLFLAQQAYDVTAQALKSAEKMMGQSNHRQR